MLIKSADDKSKRLRLLEDLQQSPKLDETQKRWLNEQLWALRKGIQGEKDAAFYLDADYAAGKNTAILHDLRLEHEGEFAQIDHLIINRAFCFFLLETKNFGGNLKINEAGEFSVVYPEKGEFGIPSPLEQSRRHERILVGVLDRLGITGRAGTKPVIEHVVLVHPKAVITRPDPKRFDTTNVIKADLFRAWHDKFADKVIGVREMVTGLMNLRSQDTVQDWGELLKRAHRPADLLALPDFMRPQAVSIPSKSLQNTYQPPNSSLHHAVKEPDRQWGQRRTQTGKAVGSDPQDHPSMQKKTLKCAACGVGITFEEGKFCWNNPKRFGGLQYCRQHQRDYK